MPSSPTNIAAALSQIARSTGTPLEGVPAAARSTGMEEVFIVYCLGKGRFSEVGPPFYINLLVDMYDFTGRWVGFQSGVNVSPEGPQASLGTPDPPPLPIDAPPVPPIPASSWTKGLFTFNDGALVVEGPALTHLTPLKDGSLLFSVTTSHVITSGTGLYEGARGIKVATGTALVPHSLITSGKFPSPGLEFPVTTIESFRLVRKQFLEAAAGGGNQPGGGGGNQPKPGPQRPQLKPGGPLKGGPLNLSTGG